MDNLELAERFCDDINKIMKNQQVTETPKTDQNDYVRMMEIAKKLAEMDLSDECGFEQKLRQRLAERFRMSNSRQMTKLSETSELDENDLQEVAGGFYQHTENKLDE